MRTLHEYPIKMGQRNVFRLPADGKILGVHVRNNIPHLLMSGDPGNGTETREFILVSRNQSLPDGIEVGACCAGAKFYVVVEI